LTITESTRQFNGEGYNRHKIFLYKEDFNRFQTCLNDALQQVKTELLPDYDYDEFTRRYDQEEEHFAEDNLSDDSHEKAPANIEKTENSRNGEEDDDLTW
jgi:hypothetical protein